MSNNKMSRDEILYQQEFGDIPNDQLGRIAYILGKKIDNVKFNEAINEMGKRIKRIKTHKIEFTLWAIVKPSARPRANTRSGYIHMYVPGAGERGELFERFYNESELPKINTPCKMYIDHYEKTPVSFNMKQKVLAELGLLRPTRRTGDVDNFSKSVLDMIQHGMLEDDCLVYEMVSKLYYSIKPHVDVKIEYLDKDPFEVIRERK